MAIFWPLLLGSTALMLFGGKRATVPTTNQPAPPNVRRPPANLTAGLELALVQPFCPEGSPPECQNGVRVRLGPGLTFATIGPDAVPPNDAMTGDLVGVVRRGLKEQGAPPNARNEWWEIITPSGGHGFARAVDAGGNANFVLVKA